MEITHNQVESRFEVSTDGSLSIADYVIEGDRMVFTHTYTPPALRGRGIAAALVRAALDSARASGYKVVPQCSYVEIFIQRHKEYRDLLA